MKNNLIKAFAFIILAAGININAVSQAIVAGAGSAIAGSAGQASIAVMYTALVSNQTGSDIEFKTNKNKWVRISPWSSKKTMVNKFKKIKFRLVQMIGRGEQAPTEERSEAFAGNVTSKVNQSFYVYGQGRVQSTKKTGITTS